MRKIIEWFKESHRWQHAVGGLLLGAVSDSWYMAAMMGCAVGGAMELKDRLWGGKADVVDAALTLGGALMGFGVRTLIIDALITRN